MEMIGMTSGSELFFSKFVTGRKWYSRLQGRTLVFRVRKELGGLHVGYSKGELRKTLQLFTHEILV